MLGYDPNFLKGHNIPLPTFSDDIDQLIVRNSELRNYYISEHPNYAIVTRGDQRAPVFSVLCIDQRLIDKYDITASKGKKSWTFDETVGEDYQLNNDYYANNPWDRGHMAMRKNAAWGSSHDEAKKASKETYYWSNCSLQHTNFNQDEWQGLEMWIQNDLKATNDRVISFALPIFSGFMRSIKPKRRRSANIPAGFAKVIAYEDPTSGQLQTRSFIMWQDVAAIENDSDQSQGQLIENNKKVFNYQRYQVSTTLVEKHTGVIFPNQLKDTNPLFYYDNERTKTNRRNLQVHSIPEYVEVDDPLELISDETKREIVKDDQVELYISAAMPDPTGHDLGEEWVSISNFGGTSVDLSDWTLSDQKRRFCKIGDKVAKNLCEIQPGQSLVVKDLRPMRLPNGDGVIILKDANGDRIDRVNYHKKDFGVGTPVNFYYQPSMHSS